MNTAAKIRKICSKKGWSQGHLAAELEVTPNTVSRWVTGESKPNRNHSNQIKALFEKVQAAEGADETELQILRKRVREQRHELRRLNRQVRATSFPRQVQMHEEALEHYRREQDSLRSRFRECKYEIESLTERLAEADLKAQKALEQRDTFIAELRELGVGY